MRLLGQSGSNFETQQDFDIIFAVKVTVEIPFLVMINETASILIRKVH